MATQINHSSLSDRYKILFVIFICLGLYYPSLFGMVNQVDDADMIIKLMNIETLDLKSLFFPNTTLQYYRPLLYLTFILDRFLWLCEASFMHLENIILHAINGVLIFFIVKILIEKASIFASSLTPLFASLIFISTPLNTEAVNWISGRTDLLAATFIFTSLLIMLKKGIKDYKWCIISAGFFLCGLLSKEVSVAFLPFVVILIFHKWLWGDSEHSYFKSIFPFLLSMLLYLIMRLYASSFSDSSIEKISEIQTNNLLVNITSLIKAFGFYIKKLFVPIPLNFAIVEIHGIFYFVLGLLSLIITLIIMKKQNIYSFLYLFSVIFFLPALPLTISKMTWTPLAERYLYISSFGISALIPLWLHSIFRERAVIVLSLLMIFSSVITINRNITWQENLTLYYDTVKKSPNFAAARNEYGVALAKAGKLNEAMEQFNIAQKLAKEKYWLPALNIIEHNKVGTGSIAEAKKAYIDLMGKPNVPNSLILERLIGITEAQIMVEKDPEKLRALIREEIEYIEKFLAFNNKNGFYFYRLGQLYLNDGKKEKAKEYFKKAATIEPNAYFAPAAMKLSEKIEAGKI